MQSPSGQCSVRSWFACLLPYAAVIMGLMLMRSAWLAVLIYHLGILSMLGKTVRYDRSLIRTQGGVSNLWLYIGTAIGLFLLLVFGWPWIERPGVPLVDRLAEFGLRGTSWFVFVIYFSLVHPLLEELHWRGAASTNPWGHFLFAGYHILVVLHFVTWPWAALSFVVLYLTSRWWACQSKVILVPVVTHALADGAIILAVAVRAAY